jgi:membrane associated rhomboid family serine protease
LLHLNWQLFILNLAALWWLGRLVERRVGSIQLALIYGASILLSGIAILIWHGVYPGTDSAVGASGGIFGLAGAALILVYR